MTRAADVRSKPDELRDARRDQILDAALALFARRGLSGTKIADIAKAAGLSHGLVYHYFPSKAAIFEEIITRRHEEAAVQFGDAERYDSVEALRQLLEQAIADARKHSELTLMVSHAVLGEDIPDDVGKRLRKGGRLAFRQFVRVIEVAQEDGYLDREIPAEQIASALFCCVRGIAFMCERKGGLGFPIPTAETLLRMIAAPGALDAPAKSAPVKGAKKTIARAAKGSRSGASEETDPSKTRKR